MNGMDRLTIDDLQYWEEYGDYDVRLMARELLAHRRASQAAPAPQKPVAWAETDHKGKVIGVSLNQYPWHPTPLYAAPAPSDGLREAVDAAWNDAIEAAEAAYAQGFAAIRALRRAAPTEGEA